MQEYKAADLSIFLRDERNAAIRWARGLMERIDWVILDTETTGLDGFAEVCQVAIIDPNGNALLDTLVKPTHRIPADASAIHGITDEMVADAPGFDIVGPNICGFTLPRALVVYNLAYDRRILEQSADAVKLPWYYIPASTGYCAMEEYARFYGQWNDYHSSFRWQRLPAIPGETAHSALADCKATLALIRRMAEAEIRE